VEQAVMRKARPRIAYFFICSPKLASLEPVYGRIAAAVPWAK
jgi:hypothetical protein